MGILNLPNANSDLEKNCHHQYFKLNQMLPTKVIVFKIQNIIQNIFAYLIFLTASFWLKVLICFYVQRATTVLCFKKNFRYFFLLVFSKKLFRYFFLLVSKRKSIWEPIFIGTKNDPPYDERLSWEGKRDKMTQAYLFCLLDYNFAILDNAFLIHKPGIKTKKEKLKNIKPGKLANQNKFIKKIVLPELKLMYGKKKGC